MGILIQRLVALSTILVCKIALAVPVTWTLQNVTAGDGGTVFGSFVYDADTNNFSNVNITSTAGSAYAGAHYTFANQDSSVFPGGSSNQGLSFFEYEATDYTNISTLFFQLSGPMTNTGGVLLISGTPEGEGVCGVPNCGSSNGNARLGISGQISAVPVPAAFWLFGSALLLLGRLRKLG